MLGYRFILTKKNLLAATIQSWYACTSKVTNYPITCMLAY